MVVRAGFGVGVDVHRARPQLLRAHARKRDSRLAVHAGGRGHIAVKLIALHNAHAIVLPVGGGMGVGVIIRHGGL